MSFKYYLLKNVNIMKYKPKKKKVNEQISQQEIIKNIVWGKCIEGYERWRLCGNWKDWLPALKSRVPGR